MVIPQERWTPDGELETPLGRICSREIQQRIFSRCLNARCEPNGDYSSV